MNLSDRVKYFEQLYSFDCSLETNNGRSTKYGVGEGLAEEFRDKTFQLLKGKITKTQFVEYLESFIDNELIEEFKQQKGGDKKDGM